MAKAHSSSYDINDNQPSNPAIRSPINCTDRKMVVNIKVEPEPESENQNHLTVEEVKVEYTDIKYPANILDTTYVLNQKQASIVSKQFYRKDGSALDWYSLIQILNDNKGPHQRDMNVETLAWIYSSFVMGVMDFVDVSCPKNSKFKFCINRAESELKEFYKARISRPLTQEKNQVRIKVFNMIAEYRRILKNPTPERKKKCVFFDALDKIYQAKDTEDVKAALNNYEEEYHFDPADSNMADETNDSGMGANGDGENSGTDNEEVFSYAMSPSQTLNGTEGTYGQVDGDQYMGRAELRSRSGSNATYSGYQAQDYSSEYESSQAVILIDRMFVHLTKEMDIMRDWIKLEKERFHQEAARRKEDNERQERREKAFLNALVAMQDQTYRFLAGSSSTFPIPPGSFDISPMDTQSTFELS